MAIVIFDEDFEIVLMEKIDSFGLGDGWERGGMN